MQPKILIIDTYYPEFLKSQSSAPMTSYGARLAHLLNQSFGTSDFYSMNLKKLGWDALDIIANDSTLQGMWAAEHNLKNDSLMAVLEGQIQHYKPDVLFFQDLSLASENFLEHLGESYILAGQCSCPMPNIRNVSCFDVLFTSFPHYLEVFRKFKVQAIYNQLAFEPDIFNRISVDGPRFYDCVFIGGVGNPSHWQYGMMVMNEVAKEIPNSLFWGYGYDILPKSSPILPKYKGMAWGLDMYKILLQSKIVINRHGEVAQGYSNNMRMYEATGCKALLMTELSPNLHNIFRVGSEVVGYSDPWDVVRKINYYLEHEDECYKIADLGQTRTLQEHTYAESMKIVSDTLKDWL